MGIAELIAAARKVNPEVCGVAVIAQGIDCHYVAVCLSLKGTTCDPRSWDTHLTPEAALADLERQVTGK